MITAQPPLLLCEKKTTSKSLPQRVVVRKRRVWQAGVAMNFCLVETKHENILVYLYVELEL